MFISKPDAHLGKSRGGPNSQGQQKSQKFNPLGKVRCLLKALDLPP